MTKLNRSLSDWLSYLETLHPKTISLGLDRIAMVRQAMNFDLTCPVITVGGTNGKGSTCAMLESILTAAGYRVGCYTSPHLLRYNERIRIAGSEADDVQIGEAFSAIELARGEVSLTYFEFGTLAATWLFAREKVDVAILEVGLGGRLDAVNIFDTDVAILTSVAMDHMDYLGDTREQIGFEKAGIFRTAIPAICADPKPPATVLQYAADIGADLQLIGRDFGYLAEKTQWQFWGRQSKYYSLAYPGLRGTYQLHNASASLAALDTLKPMLPVNLGDIRTGLLNAELTGRFQVLPGQPTVILDVAHNPHAAAALAGTLKNMGFYPRTFAVLAMLGDKDIAGVIEAVKEQIDTWLVADIAEPRGAKAETLVQALNNAGITSAITCHPTPAAALEDACKQAAGNDRIVVFGSFYTVASAMRVSRD